jgi:putative colanic acid biosynthesis UDP-glucose lipid carrier transferase
MEQPFVIKLPVTQPSRPAAPQSDVAEIRAMFKEMNNRYMVYEPPTYYMAVKRIMDVAVAMTFILLVMSWLYPIVALLIKLTSKGPVFFIQKRTGYKGVEFDCFKFRTMHVNDDADTKQATSDDKRITLVGKFLRLTHLDETAQFFNVLLGDMSIVGPRPHMLYHTRYYSQMIPYYNLRHEAVPGMTGMAQIKGYIGEINQERELRKRVQWDIYYLKNRSIWLDINIVFTTFAQVIGKAIGGFFKK